MTSEAPFSPIPTQDLESAIKTIRFLSVDAVEKAQSGHPGTPMGLSGIAVELFVNQLRHQPKDPSWPARDRFVLSCGHASMLLYSILHLSGYDVTLDDLRNFRQWGSRTPGHPEVGHTPGVETTTGPLGQGIGNAVGLALASKMSAAQLGDKLGQLAAYDVFCICSDGDVMEGVAYEAASIAGHLKLGNLIVIYDDNHITIDGDTSIAFTEDVPARFAAMGWHVQRVDGHDGDALRAAISEARRSEQPSLIAARTKIGIGSPGKEGKSAAHGAPLGGEEVKKTKEAAGWPVEPTFYVPEEAKRPFMARQRDLDAVYDAWKKAVSALDPSERAKLDAALSVTVPSLPFEELLAAGGKGASATRVISGKIQQVVAAKVPNLVGGAADLTSSVKVGIAGSGSVSASDYSGRNIHFGIREHGMGAVMNGLVLSGRYIPFGSTFLIFTDYMRPSMRLAALMKQRVIYVMTHDSVFLGEDGATHQPIEHLWALRMIPGLDVVRPADAGECAWAWTHAVERADGPTVIVASRQDLPVLERKTTSKATFDKGAYVLSDDENPEVVLIATGSEVGVAVEAAAILRKNGRRIRVVSMPCVDLFLRQSESDREAILPKGVRRATFELGVTLPWAAIAGPEGILIGLDDFGASAPMERLAEEYKVTPAHVAARIQSAL